MKIKSIHFVLFCGILFLELGCRQKTDMAAELAIVEQTIHDDIGWALTKDIDLLYSITAQDSNLLIINPDSSRIEGFAAFQKVADTFWLDPRFVATHFEVKNLKVNFSQSGTVAWFFCNLDDFGEWDGRPFGWENVRWTGVLEKRDGKWVHTQMHFSFPTSN